jgi:hypothetical protein
MTNEKQPETNRLQLTEDEHRKLAELFAKKWINYHMTATVSEPPPPFSDFVHPYFGRLSDLPDPSGVILSP